MLRYAARRLVGSLPVLLVVALLTFSMMRLAPGGPALVLLGLQGATPQAVATINREYGLNQPLPLQFVDWLGRAVRGNLGSSISYQVPVSHLLAARLPVTLELTLAALVVAIVAGTILGVVGAVSRGSWVDGGGRLGSLVGLSVPSFVFGILFVMIFGWYVHGVLPYAGWVPLSQSISANLGHLVLPAVALALAPMAIISRLLRSSMLEVLQRDYILTARAFGISQVVIVSRDALRNALLPALTAVGVIAASLIGGAVAIENIFALPGVGGLLVAALTNRDYPVISGDLLIFAVLVIITNLVVELLYGVFNPRIAAAYRGRNR